MWLHEASKYTWHIGDTCHLLNKHAHYDQVNMSGPVKSFRGKYLANLYSSENKIHIYINIITGDLSFFEATANLVKLQERWQHYFNIYWSRKCSTKTCMTLRWQYLSCHSGVAPSYLTRSLQGLWSLSASALWNSEWGTGLRYSFQLSEAPSPPPLLVEALVEFDQPMECDAFLSLNPESYL